MFEDPDKIKNYDRVYFNLVIRVCNFSDFYTDFRHYSSLLKIDQDASIRNLKRKVIPGLLSVFENNVI